MKLNLADMSRGFGQKMYFLGFALNYILEPWQLEKFDVFMHDIQWKLFSVTRIQQARLVYVR
jgi:hypothetical protein